MTSNRPQTPLWLATYIFIFGWIALTILMDSFRAMVCEYNIPYVWYYGVGMCAMAATPWIWYFTYLGSRYFTTIPRMWYILIFAPLIDHVFEVLSMKTVCSHIFIFNAQTYYFRIGAEDMLGVVLGIFVVYEVFRAWRKRPW